MAVIYFIMPSSKPTSDAVRIVSIITLSLALLTLLVFAVVNLTWYPDNSSRDVWLTIVGACFGTVIPTDAVKAAERVQTIAGGGHSDGKKQEIELGERTIRKLSNARAPDVAPESDTDATMHDEV